VPNTPLKRTLLCQEESTHRFIKKIQQTPLIGMVRSEMSYGERVV
jgi:hypothetical protein